MFPQSRQTAWHSAAAGVTAGVQEVVFQADMRYADIFVKFCSYFFGDLNFKFILYA